MQNQKKYSSLFLSEQFYEEADRLYQEVKKNNLILAINIAIVMMTTFFLFINPVFFYLPFLCSISLIFIERRRRKAQLSYSNFIKDNLVEGLFKEAFDHVIFSPEQGFDKDYIESTEMYPLGNVFSSNDLLSGSYKGVGFMQADVLIEHETTNAEGGTHVTEYFKGRWLIYDFNKEFEGVLQLRSNYNRKFFKNEKPFQWRKGHGLKQMKFENDTFNESFNAYTNNIHDAYYLVTPHFMQSLMALNDALECELVVAFIDNKLHLAIYNREDAFEIKSRKIDDAFVEGVRDDIRLIQYVVDYLDLTKDIFKAKYDTI